MANANWPATLPDDVLVDGYDESPPETVVRTEMDAGPAKIRRRFTAGVRPLKVTLDRMTRTQVAALDELYVDTLEGGALPFDWTHPRTLGDVTFRFTRPPRYRPIGSGALWNAELELEVMP